MLRCFSRRTRFIARLRTSTARREDLVQRPISNGYATASHDSQSTAASPLTIKETLPFRPRRSLIARPLQKWLDLLEPALPLDLRADPTSSVETSQDIGQIAEILLAAQGKDEEHSRANFDLLYALGVTQGRWPAAIWIIKRLVEAYGADALKTSPLLQRTSHWHSNHSLDTLTGSKDAIRNAVYSGEMVMAASTGEATLDQLTDYDPNQTPSFAHRALGQVWRSLGKMTIACAGGDMKPEILELIAYLHHMGIMPASIYNQKPTSDVTSIQQPPTLNMLSSRILISLSDAVWRAREKSLAEETSKPSGYFAFLRPNAPVTRHVMVGGLRPEAWLELLLWSCLHGGWIQQGAGILRALFNESQPEWKLFSWRSFIPHSDTTVHEWDQLSYAFNNTRTRGGDHEGESSQISVSRTVSVEVVNAYADALVNSIGRGVGERGISRALVVNLLHIVMRLLARSQLSLVSGSRDAFVLRVADTCEDLTTMNESTVVELVGLGPPMGVDLDSAQQGIPKYIHDGSAAITGLCHRAIQSRVQKGDVRGALRFVKILQTRADKNKVASIVDLLKSQKSMSAHKYGGTGGFYYDNFHGISYPDFYIRLPPTIAGPLLSLSIDAGALKFAEWLIYSNEPDGPTIQEQYYADPALAPALIRYAGEQNDTQLLKKLVEAQSPAQSDTPGASVKPNGLSFAHTYLSAFLRSQVERENWKAALQIVKYMQRHREARFKPTDIAEVARAVLITQRPHQRKTLGINSDPAKAMVLFQTVLKLVSDDSKRWLEAPLVDSIHQVSLFFIVLACADPYWGQYCGSLLTRRKYFSFDLPTDVFNRLLEGIASAHGSAIARRVLGIFWPHELRERQRLRHRSHGPNAGETVLPRFEPSPRDDEDNLRTRIHIDAMSAPQVVLYGGLQPDVATMRIMLQAALTDFKAGGRPLDPADHLQEERSDGRRFRTTPSGMLLWAVRRMQYMNVQEEDIWEELKAVLTESEFNDVQLRLADLDTIADNLDGEGQDDEGEDDEGQDDSGEDDESTGGEG